MNLVASEHQRYVEEVEQRLEAAVAARPGPVADAGLRTLAAGGKRLRPLLVSLCAAREARDRPSW